GVQRVMVLQGEFELFNRLVDVPDGRSPVAVKNRLRFRQTILGLVQLLHGGMNGRKLLFSPRLWFVLFPRLGDSRGGSAAPQSHAAQDQPEHQHRRHPFAHKDLPLMGTKEKEVNSTARRLETYSAMEFSLHH